MWQNIKSSLPLQRDNPLSVGLYALLISLIVEFIIILSTNVKGEFELALTLLSDARATAVQLTTYLILVFSMTLCGFLFTSLYKVKGKINLLFTFIVVLIGAFVIFLAEMSYIGVNITDMLFMVGLLVHSVIISIITWSIVGILRKFFGRKNIPSTPSA